MFWCDKLASLVQFLFTFVFWHGISAVMHTLLFILISNSNQKVMQMGVCGEHKSVCILFPETPVFKHDENETMSYLKPRSGLPNDGCLFYIHLTAEDYEMDLSCGSKTRKCDTHLFDFFNLYIIFFFCFCPITYAPLQGEGDRTYQNILGVSRHLCSSLYFCVNMRSLRRSADQLKCCLCLFNTALCIKLALKPWCFTVFF